MSLKQDKLRDLLYRSFDDTLSDKEQNELDQALNHSPQLREEKKEAEKLRQTAAKSGSSLSFKPFFAERVVNRLRTEDKRESRAEVFFETLFGLFKRVALIGAAACIVVIAYNLARGENLKADDALFVSQVTYEEILALPLF